MDFYQFLTKLAGRRDYIQSQIVIIPVTEEEVASSIGFWDNYGTTVMIVGGIGLVGFIAYKIVSSKMPGV